MKIKKILLTLGILTTSIISYSNAGNFTTSYYYDGYNHNIYWLELDNDITDEIRENIDILHGTAGGTVNNYYLTLSSIGNGNWLIDDEYVYRNIFKLTNTNYYGTWIYWFWNNNNQLNFASNNPAGIIKPLKMVKGNSGNFTDLVYDVNNYTYNINEIYNLTGNVKSIIFGADKYSQYDFISNSDYKYICFKFDNLDVYCAGCVQGTNKTCYGGYETLTGLNSYNSYEDFENILGESPLKGGGGETETGGTTTFCPPIKVYTDSYGVSYNENLCYSNGEEISGGAIINVTPINMFEAFPTYQDFINKYNILHNKCHLRDGNTEEECMEALRLIGKKQAEILLKISSEEGLRGQSLSRIYQYCRYKVNYTGDNERDKGICELTDEEKYAPGINSGINNGPNAQEQLITRVNERDNETFEIAIPEEGGIFDQILPDGIITRTDLEFYTTATAKLTALYIRIFKLWKARPYVEGILPTSIISLLLLFILFRIFKRKHDKDN